ncbi:MAG: hypothetical protein COW08_09440 [Ignavibacteriales bacterium CG12_big_fil_rev_8_21_14_0_65_30_8]|nr:MAG: hypothetical protein COW08_09440 [Ignavibacteriales bacterium CG12_big_fil_rev_8_21_14_0_65_30_8]
MTNYKLSSNLAISDNGFLFLSTTGETFTVNDIAKVVLMDLKNDINYKSIFDKLLKEYEVEEKILERDLEDFFNQLNVYNLLEEK